MTKIITDTCMLEVGLDNKLERRLIDFALHLARNQGEVGAPVKVDGRAVAYAVSQPVKTEPDKWPGHDPDAWNGFIIAECGKCKNTRAFCTKNWINETTCKKCGTTIKLKDKVYAHMHCTSCGNTWTYKTNAIGATVQVMCLECGAMMEAEWNYSHKAYEAKEE